MNFMIKLDKILRGLLMSIIHHLSFIIHHSNFSLFFQVFQMFKPINFSFIGEF